MKRSGQHAPYLSKLQEKFGHSTGKALGELEGVWQLDQPLARYTSLQVGGIAEALFSPVTVEALQELLRITLQADIPLFYLGKGTNLIIKDKGIRGIVVVLGREFQGIQQQEDDISDPGQVVVRAGGGVRLSRLVSFTREVGLTGLEFAVGIPGSVGGAVKMNAGTGLGTFGDLLLTATILDRGGEQRVLNKEELAFSYRTSHLPAGSVVIEARLALQRGEKHHITRQIALLEQRRRDTQPLTLPNAGCIFRNPLPCHAGQLIDEVGLKGIRIGDAQVSEKHANFIVNLGQATAKEVLQLIEQIKEVVYRQVHIELEEEVQIVGE